MRGVESIVGAYLAIIMVVGALTSMFLYLHRASSTINDTLGAHLQNYILVANPPIMSLEYVNESVFKLQIAPLIPFNLKYVVVKSVDGEVLYQIPVDAFVNEVLVVDIVIPKTPALIELITDSGVVFFYDPRRDPNLASAPEDLKTRLLIDDELIEYLKNRLLSNSTHLELYDQLGYKVLTGRTTDPTSLLNTGPHLCEIDLSGRYVPNVYDPCNAYVRYITSDKLVVYLSFYTYNYNKTYWWFDNSGYLNINTTWFWNYAQSPGVVPPYVFLQVTKLARAKDKLLNLTFYVDVRVNTTDSSLRNYVGIAVVVYILPSSVNMNSIIALAQPGVPATPWVRRILLAYYPMGSLPYYTQQVGGTTWYVIYHNGTYNVTINPSELGLSEYVVAYGVELVHWYTNSYPKLIIKRVV
jgi:hypothetical protein